MSSPNSLNDMKSNLEKLCVKKFSKKNLFTKINPIIEKNFPNDILLLKNSLGASNYSYVVSSLVRHIFLIELTNNDVSSTKINVRWSIKESKGKKQESFNSSDPRYADFTECKKIFVDLLRKLISNINDAKKNNFLKLFAKYRQLPYELPIDYLVSSTDHIHVLGNFNWFWDEKFLKTLILRKFLLTEINKRSLFLIILKKIKTKTYLTDRVQTGNYKTNREKRWESHPNSTHFALRKNCLLIERKLLSQICYFDKFPQNIYKKIQDKIFQENSPYLCPVTLTPLNFSKLKKELNNPNHGKSNFHVGHLNPLKSEIIGSSRGHNYKNIGWISDDGNRIQGSLSLKNTRKLLSKINKNYQNL